jgi:hypothetical protein
MRVLAVLLMLAAGGCTTRDFYEVVRDNARQHCYKLPDTERVPCLERTGDDYATFERKRALVQERSCQDMAETVRELCLAKAREEREAFERQRTDAGQRP